MKIEYSHFIKTKFYNQWANCLWISILIFFSGCSVQEGVVELSVNSSSTKSATVTINQSIEQTVGTCNFSSTSDPTDSAGFSYQITFSKEIDSASFTVANIVNKGSGGNSILNWTLQNCGDDKNFKLTTTSIVGDGTIEPFIPENVISIGSEFKNSSSTSTDNSVTFIANTSAIVAIINQSISETVGSCIFTNATDPNNNGNFDYKLTFSREINPTTFTTSDIVNIGTGGAGGLSWVILNCGDNKNFKLTPTGISGDGSIVPTIQVNAIADLSGNGNTSSVSTDNSVTYDTIGPTVTINQATTETVGSCSFTASSDPTNASTISFRVAFSEAIQASSFTSSDIDNGGSGGSLALTWTITDCGDNRNFKLVASSINGDGTILPSIASNTVQDEAGNNNSSSTSIDNSVTYDTSVPTVTINQATTETVGSCSFTTSSDPANTSGFSYRITFSEEINTSSFTTSDITNSGTGGGTALGWTLVNCGDNRNFKLTAISVVGDGTIVPQILGSQIQDEGGNNNSPSTSTDNNMTYDTSVPSVTINQATTETVGSCSFTAPSDPTNASTISFKVVFSEPINASSFISSDIINGGVGGSTALTWTITNCGDDTNFKLDADSIVGDGAIVAQIFANSVVDLAGNNNSLYSSTDNSVTYDTTGPTVTINQASTETVGSCSFAAVGDPTDTAGFSFKVTFNEAINTSTFTIIDITNGGTGGGTLLNWTLANCGDDKNFKLTATAITGNGTIIPELLAGKVSDLVGNTNSDYSATDNIVTFQNLGWAQEAYIKASNADASDLFGFNVALNGDTLVVGSINEDSNQTTITNGATSSSDNSLSNSGAVYIYKRSGFNWTQEAYIKGANSANGMNFGTSISIDGDLLAVGASAESSSQNTITNGSSITSNTFNSSSGAVYIYKRSNSSWVQEAYIKASNSNKDDFFGTSVSISGNILAVGAPGEDNNQTTITNGSLASNGIGSLSSGAVYIYSRLGTDWSQEAYFKTSNNNAADDYGRVLSLSNDTLAVGANQEDSNQTTITNGTGASTDNSSSDSGAVYIYKRIGVSWTQEAYVKASNNDSSDGFGSSVSISGDSLAVGAPNEDSNQIIITNGTSASSNNGKLSSGAVYVYKRSGVLWSQEAYIKAVNSGVAHLFGSSVNLNGNTLAIGASGESSNQTTITNGSTASSNISNSNSGAVYIYKRSGVTWSQEAYLKAANSAANDYFGRSIALSGDTLAVGAYAEESNQTTITNGEGASSDNSLSDSGAVYIYRNNARPFDPVNFKVETFSDSSFILVWQSSGFRTTGYKLTYAQGLIPPASCTSGTMIDVGNVLTYHLTGLTAGTFYSFRICAYDSGDVSSEGLTSTFQTLFTVPELSSLTYSSGGTTNKLNWLSGGGTTTGFKIAYSLNSVPADCSTGTIIDVNNVSTFQLTGLTPESIYGVRVCAYDSSATLTNGNYLYASTLQSGWNQEAYIKASNSDGSDYYGAALSLSADTLAVGAYREDSNESTITNGSTASTDNSSADSGAVYIYKRNGVEWIQEAYIKASNNNAGDYFGQSISLSGDTLAVGAKNEKSNQSTITNGDTSSSDNSVSGAGGVYVYKRSGVLWTQEAFIKSVNTLNINYFFGTSVSLDGNTLAVSATGDSSSQTTITNGNTGSSDTSSYSSGAIFIYKRSGVTWTQEAYIKASNNQAGDSIGTGVISLSGDTLAVDSQYEDSNQTSITNGPSASADNTNTDSGAVYIYKRTEASWAQEAYIKAVNNDAGDLFGSALSLSGDILAVGVYKESSNQTSITNGTSASSNNSNADSGAVYVYKRSGGNWIQEAYIKAVNNDAGDVFGSTLSLSGNTLAVGAAAEDSNQTTITNGTTASINNSASASGAVYIYKRISGNWEQEAYLKAVNGEISDAFGVRVSLSGDTLAVSATGEDSASTTITNGATASFSNGKSLSGAVYIYRNTARLFDPPEFSLSQATSQGITLSWKSAGSLAAGYKIAYAQGLTPPVDCSSGTVIDVGNVSNYTLSGLVQDTKYSFRICSYDFLGAVAQGYTTTYKTLAIPRVVGLAAYADSGSNITINWLSGGGVTSGFKVAYAVTNAPANCSSGTVIDIGNVSTYQITGLTPSTLYGIRLCPYDSLGSLSTGQNVSATTGEVAWNQEAYIKAANNNSSDKFGRSVALSGDTLVVGAFEEDSNQTTITNGTTASSDNLNFNCGAVYVYKRSGVNWNQEAYIKAANNDNFDNFGVTVSASKDTIAVSSVVESSNQTTITNGTTASSDNSSASSGAVYVYKRSGATWAQEAYIKASNSEAGDNFGYSISLNEDSLAVSAHQEDSNQTSITNGTTASSNNSTSNSGAVYIYKRTNSIWVQEAYIKAINGNSSDFFGYSVSLNGETLSVGAYQEDSNQTTITNGATASSNNTNSNSGAVYIYKRSANSWSQEAYIKAINNNNSDNFGRGVSINGDLLAVSAINEDSNQSTITNGDSASSDNSNSNSGAVYVYLRTGNTWVQDAYIKAANNESSDSFGNGLSISGDTLVVGSINEDSNQSTITNGASASSDNSLSNSGAVYVYKRSESGWYQEAYIKSSNNNSTDTYFGFSLSISGDTIAVGAFQENSNQSIITNGTTSSSDTSNTSSGAVYIYRNRTRLFEVSEIWSSADSSSITLSWNKSGGSSVGYLYAYKAGLTAPADCQSDTWLDIGDLSTATISSLAPNTTYTFRVCAYEDASTFTNGLTKTITTLP